MTPDEYVGRCRGLIISVADDLEPKDVGWAMHLVDHDEGPEGMAALAWALDAVPGDLARPLVEELNELIGGLVPLDSLPESLQLDASGEKPASGAIPLKEPSSEPGCCP